MDQAKTDLGNLNEKQREAVTSEAKRLLVLAGAGSGKTKTLLQRLVYLVEEKGISPSEILAVTYTKNAANEMIDRLIMTADTENGYEKLLSGKSGAGKEGEKDREREKFRKKFKWIDALTIKTFHGFCYGVMRNYGVNEFDNKFRIIGEEKRPGEEETSKNLAPETLFEVVHKMLIEQCGDREFLLKLKRYVLDYIVDRIDLDRFRGNTLQKDGRYFTTLDGIRVRSKSEQYIADWFYRHNITYQYEPLLHIKDFYFRPDFFIPDANLYLEHISDKSFDTRGKEAQFEKGGFLYAKTYESMTRDSSLFNQTLDKLVKNRLGGSYHNRSIPGFREVFNGYHENIRDFVNQLVRALSLIKVEDLDPNQVLELGSRDQHERVRNFYELAIPLLIKTREYCIDRSYLDFNDLISRTGALFRNNEDIAAIFRSRYRFILIDEFQDVNNLQVELIKQLLTPETQLYAVGDDWQSIYGFRGSNPDYIINFEKHFPEAKLIKLNLNYRSVQPIVEASNQVISHNKFKLEKELISSKPSEHKIVVFVGNSEEENIRFCLDKIRELQAEGFRGEDLLILYRRSRTYAPYYSYFKNEGVHVLAKTIHASKGLEAKVVFILGLTEGSGGFPDIWLEDRIFQVIKKANHDLLMEEERRLFYVALTRARDKLFLITEKGNESVFIREIPSIYTVRTSRPFNAVVSKPLTCPRCFSQLEKIFLFCPYCGFNTKSQTEAGGL